MAKQNMIIPCNLLTKEGNSVIDLFISDNVSSFKKCYYYYNNYCSCIVYNVSILFTFNILLTIKYKCLCLRVILLTNDYILL